MANKIQLRRDTYVNWYDENPILSEGEIAYDLTNNSFRIGDGTTAWRDLVSFIDSSDISSAISGAALTSTDDLGEGLQNLYFENERVASALNSGTLNNITFTYQGLDDTIDVSVPTVQGTQGTQGASIQGVQGTTGTQGTLGTQGAQGTAGFVGSNGAQGTQGTQGVQGTEGAQGVQGTQGTQGVQGQEGVGTQGTDGTQGTQGVMGTSGGSTSNFNYSVDANTADAKPGNGQLRFNDTTETDATFLYVDHINGSGVDIDVYLGLVKQYDKIIIQMKNDSNHYITYEVTGAVTVVSNSYVKIPVNRVADGGSGSNSFSGGNAIELILFTTGLQGPIGAQGAVGPQGTQGVQGTEGPQGVQGTQGTQGVQGTLGTQGVQGTEGAQGAAGFVGSNGAQGTQGTQGTDGAQGVQGTQGTQGVQGTTGTQGIGGTNGTQGTQGTQGQVAADPTTTVLLFGGM
jgi:hypothetical protein